MERILAQNRVDPGERPVRVVGRFSLDEAMKEPIHPEVTTLGQRLGVATRGGAVVGSVVPGLGTVIGGALGGLFTWVVMDAAVLTLEESFSRDEYKAQILGAIEQARREFKAALQEGVEPEERGEELSPTSSAPNCSSLEVAASPQPAPG